MTYWAKTTDLEQAREGLAAAEKRQDELLLTIANLSKEAINPEEAQELRDQIASLIAEVGTLKSRLRE